VLMCVYIYIDKKKDGGRRTAGHGFPVLPQPFPFPFFLKRTYLVSIRTRYYYSCVGLLTPFFRKGYFPLPLYPLTYCLYSFVSYIRLLVPAPLSFFFLSFLFLFFFFFFFFFFVFSGPSVKDRQAGEGKHVHRVRT
jgi:hypothetical protein